MLFFSVIIPVYNRAHRLPYVLESLKKQTFQDFETIIIDDASSDASYQVAVEYDIPNKVVLKNGKNSERCISRNRGIEVAKGMYICFIDSDDYHLPEHLQVMHDYICEKGCPEAFFFTNSWNETDDGMRTERCCPDFEAYNPFAYFLHYTPNPQRWAVHRSILNKFLFDDKLAGIEDLDLPLRMLAANVKFYQIKERTTVYVAASDSYTHGNPEKPKRELVRFKLIFDKPELKGFLPIMEKNRLLSMCHYQIAVQYFVNEEKCQTIKHSLKSFFLYPKGYNENSLRTMFVMCIYSIPLIGYCAKRIARRCK